MMSRAYWAGLIPFSLSRFRSQTSRSTPAVAWATRSISVVDLLGGDLELLGPHRLLDEPAGDQGLEDLLPLAGDALVGELLAGDDLAVDRGDRVGRVDRDPDLLERRGLGRRGGRRGGGGGRPRPRGTGTSAS